MVQKIITKIKLWVKNHIIDDVPPHLGDLFEGKKVNNLAKQIRIKKHRQYVESCVLEIRSNITLQAIENGCVDDNTRQLFIKYNDYLKKI